MPSRDNQWKLPPVAKIYEALTAVADGRVAISDSALEASVRSSDGKKTYKVTWSEDRTAFGSNDNASYWQGYIGYPIIATLMALGAVSYSQQASRALAGVEWKRLNDAHKRNYAAAIDEALRGKDESAKTEIQGAVDDVFSQLKNMPLRKLGGSAPPSR